MSKRRISSRWAITAGVVALGGLVVYTSDVAQASRRNATALADAKALGIPLTAAELARPIVPISQNAASLFMQVVSDMNGKYGKQFRILQKGRTASPAAYDQALSEARPVFDELNVAGHKPYLDFEFAYAKGPSAHYPKVVPISMCCRILRDSGILMATHGDPNGAISNAETMLAVANRFGDEPVTMAMLVQTAIRGYAAELLTTTAEGYGADPQVKPALRLAVSQLGPPPAIRDCMRGQAYMNISAADTAATLPVSGSLTQKDNQVYLAARVPFLKSAMQERIVAHWVSIFKALPKDRYDFRGAESALRAGSGPARPTGLSYALYDLVIPRGGSAFPVELAVIEAKRRLLLAALDGGPLPDDPLGKGSVRTKGDSLYSVGPNGVDDLGTGDDIVVGKPPVRA